MKKIEIVHSDSDLCRKLKPDLKRSLKAFSSLSSLTFLL